MGNWQLKILSGPHLGAEINLSAGTYLLGSDAACDIVLCDTNLRGQHLRLQLDNEEAHLDRLDEQTDLYLNGEKQPSGESTGAATALVSMTVISIGTLHIALGSVLEDWSDVRIPSLANEAQSLAPPSAAIEPDHGNKKTNALVGSSGKGHDSDKHANLSTFISGKNVAGFVSLMLGLITVSSLFLLTEKPAAAVKPLELNNTVAALNGVLDISQLDISQDKQKVETVKGYLTSQQDVKLLSQRVEEEFPNVRIRVYAIDEIINGVSLILKARGQNSIQVSAADTAGVFLLKGYTNNIEQWKTSLEVIKRDIAGVKDWKTDVKVIDKHDAEQSANAALSIDIKSISVGNIAFVTAVDEKKYFVGSILKSGYTISKITPLGIDMHRGTHQIRYKFGDQ